MDLSFWGREDVSERFRKSLFSAEFSIGLRLQRIEEEFGRLGIRVFRW